VGSSIHVYAVTDFFVSMYAAVTYNVFHWVGQLPQTTPSRGELDLLIIHGSLDHLSNPQMASRDSISSSFFARLTSLTNRHTHRDRPRYSFCHNRPHQFYAMHTMRPKNKERNLAVANWVLAQTTHVSDQNQMLHGGSPWG